MRTPAKPPLALRAAVRLLPPDAQDEVLGDLMERWSLHESRRPYLLRTLWCWRQPLSVLVFRARQAVARTPRRSAPTSSPLSRPRGSRLEGIGSDLFHGVRVARQHPGFSISVVLTLALAIGGATAVFGVIDVVLLRALPYPDAEGLHTLFEMNREGERRLASYPAFEEWAAEAEGWHGLAFIRGATHAYQTEEGAALLVNSFVSEGFFRIMGVPAARGRVLSTEDHADRTESAAVLSNRAWRQWFGGDPDVLGRTLRMAERSFTVVGVMPASFTYPDWGVATDLWLPIESLPAAGATALRQRDFRADSRVIARLDPDQPLAVGQARLDAVASRLAAEYPESSGEWTRVSILPLRATLLGGIRPRLVILGGAVFTLLLIGCMNLANLHLVRSLKRRREYAIRRALGANGRRIARQLVGESLVLTTTGTALGVSAAGLALGWVRGGALGFVAPSDAFGLDARVLTFAVFLTVATTLLFAGVGARRGGSSRLMELGGLRGGSTSSWGRMSAWVQAAQVGLTFVLLVGAALLSESLWRVTRVDPGFDSARLATIRINPPSPTYDEPGAVIELYRRLLAATGGVPGVERVALTNHGPGSTAGAPTRAALGGAPTGTSQDFPAVYRTVSAGYFSTLGVRVIEGREFAEADLQGGPGPLVVNQTLARRWGGESPLGEVLGVLKAARTRSDFAEPLVGRVVGVVEDIFRAEAVEDPPAVVYVPFTHNPWSEASVLARTSGLPGSALAAIEAAVRDVEPAIPVKGQFVGATTIEAQRAQATNTERFNAALVASFALVALVLATVGMYGVTAFVVSLRTRAIGVRMALGATGGGVVREVLRGVLGVTAAGLLVGALTAWAFSGYLTSLLYEVGAADPGTYAGVGLALALVATASGYLPARRARSIDPLIVLRGD